MKKIFYSSLYSFIFLLGASIFSYLFQYIEINNYWLPLIFGASALIITGIFMIIYFGVKKNKVNRSNISMLIFIFIINMAALGMCMKTWYMFKGYFLPFWLLLLISLACVVYLWVFYLFLFIPFINNHYGIFVIIFIILSLVGYIFLILKTKTNYISTFGFYMIVEIAFIFAMSTNANSLSELFFSNVIATFSVLIVAIIIAILILFGDGADFDGDIIDIHSVLQSPRKKRVENDL